MATATVATAEQPAAEQREQFLAFVADPETSSVIDQVVGEMMLPHASIREGGVKEAVKYLSEQRSPRLLLVDLSGSDLPLSEINSLADVCEPGVTVLALGDRNDCGLFRDLLQHGVADYLVKPVTPALLQKAIQGASDQSGMARTTSSKLGKLVAVSGTRGGVGATTLATSIAWLIANERRRRVAWSTSTCSSARWPSRSISSPATACARRWRTRTASMACSWTGCWCRTPSVCSC
jgi:pilus assembly protein CpaE